MKIDETSYKLTLKREPIETTDSKQTDLSHAISKLEEKVRLFEISVDITLKRFRERLTK